MNRRHPFRYILLLLLGICLLNGADKPVAIGQESESDWIIYAAELNDGWHLFRMLPDGSNSMPITTTTSEFNRVEFQSWTPDREWIIFRADELWDNPNQDLYRVHLDGTQLERLTHGHFRTQVMAWSHDGDWVYFLSCLETEPSLSECGLFRLNIDNQQLEQLIDSRIWDVPADAWSPNNEWLYVEFNSDIYRMTADGSEIQNLTNTPSEGETFQSWSPDKEWLYFSIDDLYRMRLDGSKVQRLTQTNLGQSIEAWTSDGEWIIGQDYYQSSTSVYRMRPDGSDRSFLSPPRSRFISISPDGEWLYYDSATIETHRVRLDGTEDELLSSEINLGFITWSPDGQWIIARSDGVIYKSSPDGNELIPLTEGYISNFHTWSPDGQWMIFDLAQVLYRLDLENGTLEQLSEETASYTTTWES